MTPAARLYTYWVPGAGIDREVMMVDICRYLGPDATVKPGTYTDLRNGYCAQPEEGYYVTAYQALSTDQLADLRLESTSVVTGREINLLRDISSRSQSQSPWYSRGLGSAQYNLDPYQSGRREANTEHEAEAIQPFDLGHRSPFSEYPRLVEGSFEAARASTPTPQKPLVHVHGREEFVAGRIIRLFWFDDDQQKKRNGDEEMGSDLSGSDPSDTENFDFEAFLTRRRNRKGQIRWFVLCKSYRDYSLAVPLKKLSDNPALRENRCAEVVVGDSSIELDYGDLPTIHIHALYELFERKFIDYAQVFTVEHKHPDSYTNSYTTTGESNNAPISNRKVQQFGSQVPFDQNLMGNAALRDIPSDYERPWFQISEGATNLRDDYRRYIIGSGPETSRGTVLTPCRDGYELRDENFFKILRSHRLICDASDWIRAVTQIRLELMARILGPEQSVESVCNTSQQGALSTFTAKRVKVAILDGNVDLGSDVFKPHEARLRGHFMVFIGDGKKAAPDSHGTHVAALLLEMAPEAELFVGRCFEDRERLTAGIWHALKNWRVDIISISCGFDELDEDMEEALDAAHAAGACVFAATHNEGLNRQVAFPARYKTVHGISSTDHHGNPSKTAAEPLPNKTNYAIIGENIPALWMAPLATSLKHRQELVAPVSGSSFSTPIAAGAFATTLLCARLVYHCQPKKPHARLLRRHTILDLLLDRLTGEKGRRQGYVYLKPSDLWSDEDVKAEIKRLVERTKAGR